MNYDRQITISVGNNRRDMVWKQTVLTVEELYKRLSTRSVELKPCKTICI